MADDDRIISPTLQPTQIDVDKQLLRDEDLLNEEHLRRMDQVLLRRNLDHARMFSRKLSLELQQFVHLYTPEANELRRRIEKYMVMERMIEREMARRHRTSPSVMHARRGAQMWIAGLSAEARVDNSRPFWRLLFRCR